VPSPSMHQSNPPGGVGDRPGGDGTGAAMFTVQCVMKEARRNFTFLDEAGKRMWRGRARRCFIPPQRVPRCALCAGRPLVC
jgi:hypothetical protein